MLLPHRLDEPFHSYRLLPARGAGWGKGKVRVEGAVGVKREAYLAFRGKGKVRREDALGVKGEAYLAFRDKGNLGDLRFEMRSLWA